MSELDRIDQPGQAGEVSSLCSNTSTLHQVAARESQMVARELLCGCEGVAMVTRVFRAAAGPGQRGH